jgi:anaerobic selenocysteine-containing dehydrogenase/DNA-binding NarL/FixJ family response regulator
MRIHSKELFLNVKDGARERGMNVQILVAVPNNWLQLPIIDLLSAKGEEYKREISLSGLYQTIKEYPRCIVIIDIFAFTEDHRDIVKRLKQKNPCLSLISLVSRDKVAFAQYLDSSDSSYIVPKEAIDTQLLQAIACAHKDQELIASAQNSLSTQEQKQLPTLEKKEANRMKREDGNFFERKIGRRSFLKGTAAAATVAGVAVASPGNTVMKALAAGESASATNVEEQIFAGACRGNCSGGCFLNIHVRDNKVVRTSMRELPNPEYNRICSKGLTHLQRIYHPERLKYPMKRAGKRGEGKWERISWDEAITTIADKYKEYVSQYGKESFARYTGSGQYSLVNGMGLGNSSTLFTNVTGCTEIHMNVDMAVAHALGAAFGMGFLLFGNEYSDLKNAKTILCWGANPVISWIQTSHFLLEAKEEGAKYVVIDPVYNINASKADEFVPIRPGSDGALALGMMNIIVREKWVDVPFLKKSTVAPFLVKDSDGKYLRLSDLGKAKAGTPEDTIVVRDAAGVVGIPAEISDPVLEGSFEINGIKVTTAYSLLLNRIAEYPPEKAAEICNLPVEQIEKITKLYATNKPSSIYMGMGADHYTNGHYSLFAIAALAMLTGNLGKPGAYCGTNELLPFYGNLATPYPAGATGPSISIPFTEVEQVMNEHKWGTKENLNLKMLYISHANPVNNGTDQNKVLAWLDKFEFIVMADMNMNDTAMQADMLLPVAHWFEAEDLMSSYHTHPHVMWQDKAIEPLYECKADFEILKMLADKMGYGQYFNMDTIGYIDKFLDADVARSMGLTRERLQKEKVARCVPGSAHGPEHYIFAEGGVFGTATGRAQFYLEDIPITAYDAKYYNKKYDRDKEKLPTFVPPFEAWHENPLHQKYPFNLISDHSKFHTHSQWWDVPALLEIQPEPFLNINPEDAAKLGIKTGDKAKVYNDRGYAVLHVNLHAGLQPGVLTAQKGWHKKQFIDGHLSSLTQGQTAEVAGNQAFHDVLVAVEKL